jgi:hypothetical protein
MIWQHCDLEYGRVCIAALDTSRRIRCTGGMLRRVLCQSSDCLSHGFQTGFREGISGFPRNIDENFWVFCVFL